MRRRKSEFTAALEFRLEPHVDSGIVPAARLFPERRVLRRRGLSLLPANSVHLLADDLHDLVQDFESERQIRVHARHFFVYVSRANEELCILRDLVFGRLASGLGKEVRLAHGSRIVPVRPRFAKPNPYGAKFLPYCLICPTGRDKQGIMPIAARYPDTSR